MQAGAVLNLARIDYRSNQSNNNVGKKVTKYNQNGVKSEI